MYKSILRSEGNYESVAATPCTKKTLIADLHASIKYEFTGSVTLNLRKIN
jgi:hypothetical protein